MNDSKLSPADETTKGSDVERTKQVTVAGWTAGLSAFFALGTLCTETNWPMAFGVVAVMGMMTAVCSFILKR